MSKQAQQCGAHVLAVPAIGKASVPSVPAKRHVADVQGPGLSGTGLHQVNAQIQMRGSC